MSIVREEVPRPLRLDNILSTQPDIGPNVPDGGYGWIIVLTSMFFQILIPSLSVGYGIILMFNRLELTPPDDPLLWDVKLFYTPLFYMMFSTIFDPLSRKLIINNRWPKFVGYSGTCLICGGLILLWFGVSYVSKASTIYIFSGLLSGIGSSLVTSLCDTLICQHFKLKIKTVNNLIQITISLGFVITPILLGHYIVRKGISHTLLWYQIIILQGLVVSMLFKKPFYLKGRETYKPIGKSTDDEEDIFSKPATELRNTIQSTATIERIEDANGESSHKNLREELAGTSMYETDLVESQRSNRRNWEEFDDEDSTPHNIHKDFAQEFNSDLYRTENMDESHGHFPKPLYESRVNNNTSYSFDAETTNDRGNIFLPAEKMPVSVRIFELLTNLSLYKSILQIITTKFSVFVFFTLFPSHLYNKVDFLRPQQAATIVGLVGVGGVVFAVLLVWIDRNSQRRSLFFSCFCYSGSIGFMIISGVRNETLFVIGAILVVTSINSLNYLGSTLNKLHIMGETSYTHCALSFFSSFAFMIFLPIDMNYVTCFRLLALMQFITGSIWFCNLIYKKLNHELDTR